MSKVELSSEEVIADLDSAESVSVSSESTEKQAASLCSQTELDPIRSESEPASAGVSLASTPILNDIQERQDSLTPQKLAFTPFSYLQDATQKFVKDNGKSIFVSLLFILVGFKFMFGPVALATLLLWAVVSCVLTRVQHLNARYELASNSLGLSIKRVHYLGHELLELPWHKINHLELENSKDVTLVRITPQKNAVNCFNRTVFQDVFDKQSILIRHNHKDSDNKAISCEGKSSEIKALSSEDKAFFLNLEENCPAGKFKKHIEEATVEIDKIQKPQFLGESNYELIQYSSLNRFQRGLSKFLKKAEKLLMFPLFFGLAALLVLTGAKDIMTILISGVFVPLLLISLLAKEKVLSLFFTAEGIRLVWNAEAASQCSKLIPWDAIEFVSRSVEFTKAKNKEEIQRIDFRINSSSPQAQHLQLLRGLSVNLFKKRNGVDFLSVDLDAISDFKDRQHLLSAISRFLPAERIDASVGETLNPTDPASYTKLWMDSLGAHSSNDRRFDGKLALGQQLRNGCFEIVEFLGAGGQASVYLARSKTAGATSAEGVSSNVVLKEFILPSHAGADLSVRSLEHIEKELQLMKVLQHPNIVEYHDIFVEDHRCYLVLEHVEGKSLRAMVEESGPLPEKQVLDLALQMSRILQHLHKQRVPVVHRDFTPENLILDKSGRLKVIDFNLAQQLEEAATRTIVGKHSYLPPEQFRGKACPQSDIYAMGATLYFLLTGQEPEPLSCSQPILLNESVSGELNALVSLATELELDARFKDAGEIERKIQEII